MDEKEREPTQTTEQGLEIPVPTREQVERDLAKVAQPVPPKPSRTKHRKRTENEAARQRARDRSSKDD